MGLRTPTSAVGGDFGNRMNGSGRDAAASSAPVIGKAGGHLRRNFEKASHVWLVTQRYDMAHASSCRSVSIFSDPTPH